MMNYALIWIISENLQNSVNSASNFQINFLAILIKYTVIRIAMHTLLRYSKESSLKLKMRVLKHTLDMPARKNDYSTQRNLSASVILITNSWLKFKVTKAILSNKRIKMIIDFLFLSLKDQLKSRLQRVCSTRILYQNQVCRENFSSQALLKPNYFQTSRLKVLYLITIRRETQI